MSPVEYDYGDGSLNTVKDGYVDNVYFNNKTFGYTTTSYHSNSNHRFYYTDSYSHVSNELGQLTQYICNDTTIPGTIKLIDGSHPASGLNSVAFSSASKGEFTYNVWFHYGGYTTSVSVGAFKLLVDGSYYTLKQCVDSGYIKPLVLLSSNGDNGNYWCDNTINLYDNGTTSTGSFPYIFIVFMSNPDYTISGIQFNSNKSITNDGVSVFRFPIENARFTISRY